jgi:hypothetical protein
MTTLNILDNTAEKMDERPIFMIMQWLASTAAPLADF